MKQRKYFLFLAFSIAFSLIVGSAAYGQGTSEPPKPACGHACPGTCGTTIDQEAPNDAMRDWGAFNLDNIPASPEEFIANHPRLAKAWKFLNDASVRSKIESPMSSPDKQSIESAVTEVKGDIEKLKALRPQFVAARTSGDTAQIHAVFHEARPSIKQIRADRKLIIAIIAKYKNTSTASSQLLDPVYPNPFTVGGGGLATVSYHLKNDGPVNITITDAFGTIVKHISNVSESAGDHTLTVGPETISKPGTYYVTVEADNTKSTQKVAAVQ